MRNFVARHEALDTLPAVLDAPPRPPPPPGPLQVADAAVPLHEPGHLHECLRRPRQLGRVAEDLFRCASRADGRLRRPSTRRAAAAIGVVGQPHPHRDSTARRRLPLPVSGSVPDEGDNRDDGGRVSARHGQPDVSHQPILRVNRRALCGWDDRAHAHALRHPRRQLLCVARHGPASGRPRGHC